MLLASSFACGLAKEWNNKYAFLSPVIIIALHLVSRYIMRAGVSSTMGPGFPVQTGGLTSQAAAKLR